MTAVTVAVKPVSQIQLTPGSAVTIPNVSWEEFESILQELGEKRSARVAYSKGTLEIMVPLPEREKIIPATVERAWQVGSVQALEEFEMAIAIFVRPTVK